MHNHMEKRKDKKIYIFDKFIFIDSYKK